MRRSDPSYSDKAHQPDLKVRLVESGCGLKAANHYLAAPFLMKRPVFGSLAGPAFFPPAFAASAIFPPACFPALFLMKRPVFGSLAGPAFLSPGFWAMTPEQRVTIRNTMGPRMPNILFISVSPSVIRTSVLG